MRGILLGAAAALFVLMSPANALADDSKVKVHTGEKDSYGNADYGYDFQDDLLEAGLGGPAGGSIIVRPGGIRRTLIRPRTSFVPEMLKSVEMI